MARKSREIKIVVHEAPNMMKVFKREEVLEFWIEKAKVRINNSNLSTEDMKLLKTKVSAYEN